MKFYNHLLVMFLLIYFLLKPTSSEIYANGRSQTAKQNRNTPSNDCEPGCANVIDQRCNNFELELRAIMVKCTKVVSPFSSSTPKFEEDSGKEEKFKCHKKLHATLKIMNQGETTTTNQFVLIDHVIDTTTGQKVSILNPYVIVIKQKPLQQLYGLKYKNMVNGEAREQVINKWDPNFSGCDDISDNPTCGTMKYNGDIIPFSQGFCCSCDEKKNVRRQPRSSGGNSTTNVQELIYQLNKWNENAEENQKQFVREKKSVERKDFNDYRNVFRLKGKNPIIYVTPKVVNPFIDSFGKIYEGENRLYNPESKSPKINRQQHNIQIRGGQNCDEEWGPTKRANPSTYHDSAHCLRFSKLWYTMYQLSDPVLDHSINIKIFEKRESEDGATVWVDLTPKTTIGIGSMDPKFEDKSVLVTYDTGQQSDNSLPFSLDPKQKQLLIPQPVPMANQHPEFEGGPAEYLVVDTRSIQTSGDQCDAAGVGFSAFYNQPDRCSVPRGSCLQNQPSQLWKKDKQTCKERKRGQYFLKNYARVPDDALRRTRGDSKYLALDYSNAYKSTLEFDIRADDNIVFRNVPLAKITEVYIDSTSATTTVLTIKIHNNGLTSNVFHPRLTDCPLELPVDWGNLEGDSVLIPPQHHWMFTLRLLGIVPVNNFYCSVEALSSKNEIVAVRRIRIVRSDRCICAWHCLCACYVKTGMGCVPMTMEHYRAAGFIGSMPLSKNMLQSGYLESVGFGFFFFVLLLIIIFLLMGLTKALIGLCFVPVGIWGLDMLIGLRRMNCYYEDELIGREVVYDDDGWPVNPDTRHRNVRIVELKVEFCLNLIFFFTYPVMLILLLCRKICCPFYAYYGDEDKDAYFESVNAVSYTKCPGSESDIGNEDIIEFEGYDCCTDD